VPPSYLLVVVPGTYIRLTRALALALWLLVVVQLSLASLPPAGVLDCRDFVMSAWCQWVEVLVPSVRSLQSPALVSYLEAPRFSPLQVQHLELFHLPVAFFAAVLFLVLIWAAHSPRLILDLLEPVR
jgi:hypothetical protein